MQQPDHLDALALDAVDNDKRGSADDQFTGASLASRAAHLRVVDQHVYLVFNFLVLADCGYRVVLGDVVQLLKPIFVG